MPIRNPIESVQRTARNSPWLVMSILVHVTLVAALGFVVMKREKQREKPSALIPIATRYEEPDFEPIPEPTPVPRHAIPQDVHALLVDDDTPVYVPTDLDQHEVDPQEPIGDPWSTELFQVGGASGGTGMGVGIGGRHGTGPSAWSTPFPGRNALPPKGNSTSEKTVHTEKAIREGLTWLCRHQNPDGSWGPRSLPERCDPKQGCYDETLRASEHYDEGITALALLCFLGAGFSHESEVDILDPLRSRRYRTGEVVKKGLNWLRSRQNPDGSFSRDRAFMYNEALATMALAEAYGLTGKRVWKEPAQRGVDFLQRAQRPSPAGAGLWGWRYASRQDVEQLRGGTGDRELYDSDTSVTAWCVMALKSAQLSRLSVQPAAFDGAATFCDFVTAPAGERAGLVGYVDAKSAGQPVSGPFDERFTYHPTSMSALGMCIRIFARHDASDPFLDAAAERIVQDLPQVTKDHSSVDYYYWYYASLALNQLDGPDSPRKNSGRFWKRWNGAMNEALLGLQDHSEGACSRGGWTVNDRWASYSATGPLYATAMSVLTLEVYYRYPNAFGRKRN